MTFLLSSTFTDSLGKLTTEEQKLAKTTAFDLQVNPANPGHQFHKLDRARDRKFWSVRVSSDIRIIVHQTEESLVLCYVDHHDKAYSWAERRKLEVHPQTGAAQLVEIRETVQEVIVHKYVEENTQKPVLFTKCTDNDLLSWGVPLEWLPDVRLATEDSILELSDHLPAEASEALLEVAVGGWPAPRNSQVQGNAFTHPDAQRRFQVVADTSELQLALDSSWEKWITFLHPEQRSLVSADYPGPFRVSGSSGTGKTIVALHRAVHLARANTEARVLLATFSEALAHSLSDKLRRLLCSEPSLGERIEVHSMLSLGLRLFGRPQENVVLVEPKKFLEMIREASDSVPGHHFTESFLKAEWEDIIEAWDLQTWEDYRTVPRLGRKTRLPEAQRQILWLIYSELRKRMGETGAITEGWLFNQLTRQIMNRKYPLYEYVVVDEAQDISLPQLRFLAAFGANIQNRLFFAGDTAQRIFRPPFSWKAAGIELRGRSKVLKINYRTSHQIRKQADRLLGREVSDVDGNIEDRSTTVSVFSGPAPRIDVCESQDEEINTVGNWLKSLLAQGYMPHELAIIVRSSVEVSRAKLVVKELEYPFTVLDEHNSPIQGHVSLVTMHMAKGLEFRGVAVMACDAKVIPNEARIEGAIDTSELEEIYNTERNLLYVACTRARDFLLVTSGGLPSEFLRDLKN